MMKAHHHHHSSTTTTASSSCASFWPTTPRVGLARAAHQKQRQQDHQLCARPSTFTARAGPNAAPDVVPAATRAAAACAAAAALVLSTTPLPAYAEAAPTTVYFGNGCFWGRQKDYVDTELRTLSRPPERVSAVAGYAGGAGGVGAGGKVCYHFNDPRQVYERLGHAEVVAVDLDSDDGTSIDEMRAFSKTYFSQFKRLRDGRLQRLDPQDAGPGYRNVVGLPGGIRSPLFDVLKSEAPAGVQLREGQGRAAEGGAGESTSGIVGSADEGDEIGVVWVVDSSKLPFYRAEQYHQYHRGLEGNFPASYLRGQRDVALKAGRIEPTGCLEFPF